MSRTAICGIFPKIGHSIRRPILFPSTHNQAQIDTRVRNELSKAKDKLHEAGFLGDMGSNPGVSIFH